MKTLSMLTAIAATVAVVTSCNSKPEYDATGIFETTVVTVSAETAGRILTIDAEEGDSVRAGSVLATVDSTTLLLQRYQIMSQQQSVENTSPDIAAQASSLRARIVHQRHEVERFDRLLADGAATQKQADDTRAQLRVLEGELDALLSTLGRNRSSISDNAVALQYQGRQIDEMISKCSVTSPLTGTVLVKYAEAGDYANPGKPLLRLADLNNVYLRSYFTAGQLADLKLGQKVTVISDYGSSTVEYPGEITWIAEESEFTPKNIQTNDSRANLVYAVKIAVKNDGRIKLGQYGEVKL